MCIMERAECLREKLVRLRRGKIIKLIVRKTQIGSKNSISELIYKIEIDSQT